MYAHAVFLNKNERKPYEKCVLGENLEKTKLIYYRVLILKRVHLPKSYILSKYFLKNLKISIHV